ncbi:hypothetical protein FRC04_008876 [Tulasnella sp. 424]|nr:hypothetical protein FRC04_008876 [Tulasnella sp. 424]
MTASLLYGLSYLAAAAAFIFVTLSLASGLLWLAELIEENSKIAKAIGIRLTYAVILLHLGLWFTDNLPIRLVAFSIFCHVVYLQNFSVTWPLISLTSWSFLGSCVLVVADHFLWFFHFANHNQEMRRRGGYTRPPYHQNPQLNRHHSFMEVASFFGTCIWLIPLFLFLSLSANDNALPTAFGDASMPNTPTVVSAEFTPQKVNAKVHSLPRQSLFKTLFDPLFGLLSVLRLRRAKRRDDGIIAPPTPTRSPLLSPRPLTPTGVGLGIYTSGAEGQTLTSPGPEGWKGPTTRLQKPPPPRRVTTDGITMAKRASFNAAEARDGLRPRRFDSRPTTPTTPSLSVTGESD